MNCAGYAILLAVMPLLITTGCATPRGVGLDRDQLVALLQGEMRENSGWERVHAADALCDHHATEHIASLFAGAAETAEPPFRIGFWRVMARVSANETERQRWIERLRKVMLDNEAPDRVSAAESLAKLGSSLPADSADIEKWIGATDDATAAFPLWLLVISGTGEQQTRHEGRLANLLQSPDAIARLRAGFALGRLGGISAESRARLSYVAEKEPGDSPARAYLLSAALRQTNNDAEFGGRIKRELLQCLQKGSSAGRLEAAVTIGKCGSPEDGAALQQLLKSSEPDGRIGAASGLLYLLQ